MEHPAMAVFVSRWSMTKIPISLSNLRSNWQIPWRMLLKLCPLKRYLFLSSAVNVEQSIVSLIHWVLSWKVVCLILVCWTYKKKWYVENEPFTRVGQNMKCGWYCWEGENIILALEFVFLQILALRHLLDRKAAIFSFITCRRSSAMLSWRRCSCRLAA
jgi:hypothetical protein